MAERIPVGTEVIVALPGLNGKKRRGVVVEPELVKGYNVKLDGEVGKYSDKKVKRAAPEKVSKPAAGRRPTKLTIPDEIERSLQAVPVEVVAAAQHINEMREAVYLNTLQRKGDLLSALSDGDIVGPFAKPVAPHRSPAYLAHIRRMNCCNCGAPAPSDPHHEGKRGVGQKCSDLLTAPLCRGCHRYYTDKNVLPSYGTLYGKRLNDRTRQASLDILHAGQIAALTSAIERLPRVKAVETLAAALALVDEETMKETLR